MGFGILFIFHLDISFISATIEITNASGVIQQWKLKLKFVKFFLKGLWDTYSRLSGGSLLDPNAPPRMKRKLNLGDTEPEVYKVVTEDKVKISRDLC